MSVVDYDPNAGSLETLHAAGNRFGLRQRARADAIFDPEAPRDANCGERVRNVEAPGQRQLDAQTVQREAAVIRIERDVDGADLRPYAQTVGPNVRGGQLSGPLPSERIVGVEDRDAARSKSVCFAAA